MNASAKKDEGTNVVKLTAGSVPAHLKEKMKTDAGKGVSTSAEDSMVPRLYVLQPLSPQVLKQKQEYIKGAEAGDIWLRNASKPIVKEVLVQPCHFFRTWTEWVPKNDDGSGGGYVGEFPYDATDKDRFGLPADVKKSEDPETGRDIWSRGEGQNVTEFKDTRNHACLIYMDGGVVLPYLISLSSTGHTVSRQWTFMMKSKVVEGEIAPSWACLYKLSTVMRTKGQYNWFVLDPHDASEEGTVWADEAQYIAGKTLAEAFEAGAKKAEAPVDIDAAASAKDVM